MSDSRGAIKLGLGRTRKLLSFLGNPEKRFRSIQITGTNGKGSTAIFLHNLLTDLGFRVGVYTSPHIVDPEERVRVGGELFRGDLLKEIEALRKAFLRRYPSSRFDEPTFFELVTAVCLSYFRESRVDFAVLETGLGGRLDAVTAAGAEVVVCTSISLDHQEYLGNSLEEVLMEKIHPFRGGFLVLGRIPDLFWSLVWIRARVRGGKVISKNRDFFFFESGEGRLNFVSRRCVFGITLSVGGRFQHENCSLALAGLEALLGCYGMEVEKWKVSTIRKALRRTKIPGRMELVETSPRVYLDVGHNVEASETISSEVFGGKRRDESVLLFTLPDNRDLVCFLMPFAGYAGEVIYVALGEGFHTVESARFASYRLGVKLRVVTSFEHGLRLARDRAGESGVVLVTGSYHIVERYYRLVGKKPVF